MGHVVGIKSQNRNRSKYRPFRLIGLTAGLFGSLWSTTSFAQDGDEAQIDVLLKARDYDAAIALIQKNNAEGRADKNSYLTLARIYLEKGAGIAAETAVDRAKALGATYAETAVPYAKSFLVQGQYAKAIDILSGAEIAENQQAEALIVMADANFAEGRFDAARLIYEQAKERFPEGFSAYLGLARLDLRSGNLDRADEYLRLAEVRAPNNTMVQYTSGLIKQYQGERAAAEGYFLKAVELFPGNLLANLELASLNIARAQFAEAEAYLDKVYEGTPNHPLALYMSAVIATQNGDYKLADNLLGRTRRLTERFLPAIYLRGIVAYALGEYSQAIYVLERGLTALPTAVEIRTLLAASYLRSERYQEAYKAISPVIASKDRTNNHLVIAGAALAGLGQAEQARTYFEQAKFDGKAVDEAIGGQINLSSILSGYVLNQDTQSISAFENLVGNQKADLQNLGILASMQMRAEDYDSAQETIQKILTIAPDRAFGQNMLGSLNYRMGNHVEAIAAFDKAISLNANYGAALKNRGLANMALGNFAAVEDDLRSFIRANPSDMRAIAILAKALLEQNDNEKLDEAISLFSAVLQAFPTDIDLAVDYARALDRSGARAQAISHLRSIGRSSQQIAKFGRLGEQLLTMQSYAPAARVLSKYRVSNIDPLSANILYGRALLKSGLRAGAIDAFERASRLAPDDDTVKMIEWYSFAANVGRLNFEQVEASQQKLDPSLLPSDMSLAVLGKAYEALGDMSKAITIYTGLIENAENEQNTEINLALAEALKIRASSGDRERAIELIQQLLEGAPQNMLAQSRLADLFFDNEQFGEAIPHYETLIRSGNTSALILAKLARSYQETGTGEPTLFADRARLIAPNDAYVLDVYGWILLQVERNIDGAIQAFESALKRDADNSQLRYHYGMALLANGDQDGAIRELEIALQGSEPFFGREDALQQLSILK
ncbi:XrtA/PEP-CTERM system TPR-repeat protein PrsT [Kordiimonas sp. SCSIO 12610]|uniref:XrtA/PEP-CTERM system TPR-repeat protein PrsT n=1 Tax=Kordiimonas sp. SCSIO 12610 TaxID=2829597 RepID=UPI00210F0F04|nr:XrtA/PEP-CTERM system TPR-repeat protein PrsT [Kordiimonas sp. SCSIO 12610]UTW54161.1 PEP-CTERM system TPR-repeat protein PrsT [Kordiimonas sp. SCSIO 12610]